MSSLKDTILQKKAALAEAVEKPLAELAERCAELWPNADRIDQTLRANLDTVPYCHLLYAWDVDGIEISSLVTEKGFDDSWRGRDLSQRPYLKNHLPFKGIMLSSVYTSEATHKLCITALQAVRQNKELLGFIAADFAINDLLLGSKLATPELGWQQFKGDPSVRSTVFMQERTQSLLDEHIDEVNELIESLIVEHGVFHTKIHYSSGRCTFWLMDDPYSYRIHGVNEIIDPDICLAYPLHDYTDKAKISRKQLHKALSELKDLRFADETIYLRSASINIMNGIVGLTFSCDGSHYMPIEEFIEKDLSFWLGSLGTEDSTSVA